MLGLTLSACSVESVSPSPSISASPEPTVAPTPDIIPPTVVNQDPAPGGIVGPFAPLMVGFSEPVIGLERGGLTLRDAADVEVPITISIDESAANARVTPMQPLTVATRYSITLTEAVHDSAGNSLAPTTWGVTVSDAVSFRGGMYTGYRFDGEIRHLTAVKRATVPQGATATTSGYQTLEGQGFLQIAAGPLAGYWIHGSPAGRALDDTAAPVTPRPACDYVDIPAARTDEGEWATAVLDTVFQLPSSYRPDDLVSTSEAGLNGGHLVRRIAVPDLAAMTEAAAADGIRLAVLSSFRSYSSQIATFDSWVRLVGYAEALLTSARPGHSEHQLGTTIDFRSVDGPSPFGVEDWITTQAGAWMAANAWKYGWIMSYPKGTQAASCYSYEPWHYRYFGRETARAIHESGLTEREWLWRQGFGILPFGRGLSPGSQPF